MTFWYFILSCASFSFDSLMARTGLCDFDCSFCSWLYFYQTSAFLCVWGSNGSVILLSKHADLLFSSLVKMNHFVSCLIFMSEAAYGIRLICYKRIFDADLCFVFIQLIIRSMKSLSLIALIQYLICDQPCFWWCIVVLGGFLGIFLKFSTIYLTLSCSIILQIPIILNLEPSYAVESVLPSSSVDLLMLFL